MKLLKTAILMLLISILLCSCGKSESAETTSVQASVVESQQVEPPSEDSATTSQGAVVQNNTSPAENTTATPTMSLPEKTGDMIFTDSPDNKFINSISSAYGIDASRLACIYTDPANDNNYVWQFKNTTDENGRIIKTPETLQYVYILTQDCSSIARAAGLTGNVGCSAAEGYVVVEAMKQLFIPKHQQELYS